MTDRLTRRFLGALAGTAAALLVLAGCVVQQQRPITRLYAEKATAEVPADELLDVGVRLFDPNIPEDEAEREKKRVFPDVRHAESRYIPTLIRDTLEDTGYWGQARVLPRDGTGMDVYVDGRILESTGREIKLDVTVTDATGRTWFTKVYEADADLRAYKDTISKPRDPFDNVYNTLANDLLAARRKLSAEQRVEIREVSDLRFANDLAPYAFGSYLTQDRKGVYKTVRLPAPGDPMMERMDRVRERDYTLVDTLNEHYTTFGAKMSESYTNWRKYSHEELEAESLARRQSITRQVLGAAAVIGGIVAESQVNSSAGLGGGDRGGAGRHLRGQERFRQARRDQAAQRIAEAARRLVPGRGAADGHRYRGPHAAAQGFSRGAVRRMAPTAQGPLRERDRAAGGDQLDGHRRRTTGGHAALIFQSG